MYKLAFLKFGETMKVIGFRDFFGEFDIIVSDRFRSENFLNPGADHNEILSEASLGWGKGCIRFWARSDQNSGFQGNR